MTIDPLLKWREEFPILGKTIYLINNSLGAMPRGVYDSLRDYADMWAERGIRAWGEGWWNLNAEVGNQVGALIGAPPNTVSMHQNVSLALGVLLTCFDFEGPRNRVVIESGIFPSVYYVLRGMLPSHVELHMVESTDGGITVPEDRIVSAIDGRTALVVVSHVLFRSAYILDIESIVRRAQAVGAMAVVDGYHAGGIVPVDVQALGVDYYLGGVLKWMCGGPGGAFLYAREDHLKTARPKLTGWMAHRRPFDFDVGEIELRDDAYRFLNGTPAVPNLYAVRPGVEIIGRVGVDAIRLKSLRQTQLIVTRADAAGFPVNTVRVPEKRGGTVVVNPPHAYEVSRELIARNILVDYRPGAGIRISPHFYNSDAEIHVAMDAIVEIVSSGAWERHTRGREFIT